ncbi:MAG: S8 family peptidase [Gemmataceae bacterium]
MPPFSFQPGRTPQPRRQGKRLSVESLEDRTVLSSASSLSVSVGPFIPTIATSPVTVAQVPTDPRFTDQWALQNTGQGGGTVGADVNATRAWDVVKGSARTTVAIMDTGVDYTHPDLYLNIWINQGEIPASRKARLIDINGDGFITFRDLNDSRNQGVGKITDLNGNGYIDGGDLIRPMGRDAFGRDNGQGGWDDNTDADANSYRDDLIGWNFVNNTNNPLDDYGHGTHVAGIIGAIRDNNLGGAGVADGCQMMVLKFLDGSGNGSITNYIAALNYSVKEGAKVTNNSWTGANYDDDLIAAINSARAAGQIFVGAAGNGTTDNDVQPVYPASFKIDNVISVAATDRYDRLAGYSAYGDKSVHLAAPGSDIYSTLPGGKFGMNSGTSMATPFVTAAAALVWTQHPTWTYKQVITQILSTVDKVTGLAGKTITGGRLDIGNAVGAVQAQSTPPRITAAAWSGSAVGNLTKVRVTFDRAITVSTFTSADVVLTSPAGTKITLSGVQVVPAAATRCSTSPSRPRRPRAATR